ncbi:hypothetical protein [Methylocystis parvus]|uniref:Transposase n=1 Tax=Methylocystis parvus TaxID=134 RepID=A0A6B8MB56_9HYPH|nr:hypothetical protein [Methylocystis parvus]QGM98829.1 transposase [Methylocystis parvus]WBK00821.1 hypothetical protein MMG94_03605 [Methylocystis parvus OBBP]
MMATKSVRKGAEGLAAMVCETTRSDHIDWAIYAFRIKKANSIKPVF